MRFEMVFHSYIEVFNRLISLRFDLTDWVLQVKNTSATTIIYIGPIHIGYTNQNILNERIKEMIASFDQDFADYQVKEKVEYSNLVEINPSNIVH